MSPKIEYPRLRGRIYERYQTQADLANEIGVDRQWIGMRLAGKVRFSKDDVDVLRKVLEINPDKIDYYFANREQVLREEQEEREKWERR